MVVALGRGCRTVCGGLGEGPLEAGAWDQECRRAVCFRDRRQSPETEWAAFGEFSDVTTCHRFTRGESPYPEPEPILVELKKSVSTHDASRTFLYTDRGELIFAHASRSDGPDWRVYWTDEQVLKIQRGDTVLPVETPPPAVAALWASGTAAFRLCVHATRAEGVWTEL